MKKFIIIAIMMTGCNAYVKHPVEPRESPWTTHPSHKVAAASCLKDKDCSWNEICIKDTATYGSCIRVYH